MNYFRPAPGIYASVAMALFLTACGGGPPAQTPTSSYAPLRVAIQPPFASSHLAPLPSSRASRGTSWLSPHAKQTSLLYITGPALGLVDVFSNPAWKPLGQLLGLSTPYTFCTDAAQDVYVTDLAGSVREYAHGQIAPMRVLVDHQGGPLACASDPTTGNLAVSNFHGPNSTNGNVIVYQAAKGTPTLYIPPNIAACYFVAYDPKGNLFVDGISPSGQVLLAELPKGKSAFANRTMNETLSYPGGVAWDGEFLAIGDQRNTIYQFKVSGGQAIAQGSTVLADAMEILQFLPTGGTPRHPQAIFVLGADYNGSLIGKWDYPAGGTAVKTLPLSKPTGVTISN